MVTRHYSCDECETLYASYDEAKSCEEHHEGCKELRVVEAEYTDDIEYPTTIIVFSSGSKMSGKYVLSSFWDRSLPQLGKRSVYELTDGDIKRFMECLDADEICLRDEE